MAINANIAVSNIQYDGTGQKEYIYATLTYNGTYAASGGDVFDIPAYFFNYKAAPKLPVTVFIQGTNGYGFGYVPGTTPSNGKIKITTASNTELGNIAYGAPITGDTGIIIEICTKKA
jgi:hypothetical protein